jgi:hypothetical protein
MSGNASLVQSPRLLDQVRGKIRLKHYSIRTEQAYVDWIKRFVLHFDKRHPAEMGAREVEAFLMHLAVQGRVAAATQNQAKAALLFLYREVLEQDLPWLQNVEQESAQTVAGGTYAGGGASGVVEADRHALACGGIALWVGAANHGGAASKGERCGICTRRNSGAGRQGF